MLPHIILASAVEKDFFESGSEDVGENPTCDEPSRPVRTGLSIAVVQLIERRLIRPFRLSPCYYLTKPWLPGLAQRSAEDNYLQQSVAR